MKKRIVRFGVLLLTVAMMFTLVACGGTQGKIKKNFENEGYTVVSCSLKDSDIDKLENEVVKASLKETKKNMKEEDLKKAEKYEFIFVGKEVLSVFVPSAMIIAYPSAKELKEEKGYETYEKEGLVRDNCVLTPLIGDYKEVKEIFAK